MYCGGTTINIKDTYVYSPEAHLKNKYPTSVVVTGSQKLDKVKIKDNLVELFKTELESHKIFKEVGMKSTKGYDVEIAATFTEIKEAKRRGLQLAIVVKQLPEGKLIYKNKYKQLCDEDMYRVADNFTDMLKKVVIDCIDDIDNQFASFAKQGKLPTNVQLKNIICAVFPFNDTIENEKYGDALTSMLMSALTQTANIKVVEREKIGKAIKELAFQSSGFADLNSVRGMGKFLNADYLVYGDVSKVQDTYHVNVCVVDVSKGEIILSQDVETENPNEFKTLMCHQANYIAQFMSN